MYDIVDGYDTVLQGDDYQEYFDTVKESDKWCPLQKNVECVEYTVSHEPVLNLYSLEKVMHTCARGYIRNTRGKTVISLVSVTIIKRSEQSLKLLLQYKLNQFVLKSMDKDSLLQFVMKYIEKYPNHEDAAEMLKSHQKTLYSDIAKKVYGYSEFKKREPQPIPTRPLYTLPRVINFNRVTTTNLSTHFMKIPEIMVQGPNLVPTWQESLDNFVTE